MPKRNQAQCGQDAFTSFQRREDRERERKASFSRPTGHSAAAHRPLQGSLRRLTIVVLLHLPAVGWLSPLPPHSDKEVQLICKLFSPQITETEPSSPFPPSDNPASPATKDQTGATAWRPLCFSLRRSHLSSVSFPPRHSPRHFGRLQPILNSQMTRSSSSSNRMTPPSLSTGCTRPRHSFMLRRTRRQERSPILLCISSELRLWRQ